MKKIGVLLLLLSSVSFANYTQIYDKYMKLESSFAQLVETENKQFSKVVSEAENTERELQQKVTLKSNLEEKISKLESVSSTKYYQAEYSGILKEYKGIVATLNNEIKELTKKVSDYNSVITLKGGK